VVDGAQGRLHAGVFVKNCSAATQSLLAASEYLFYELYDITLATGAQYHYTSGEVPLNNVTVYVPGGTLGPFNYQTGVTLVRDTLSQKSGTEAGTLKFAFVPQGDSPNSPIQIAGYSPQEAARFGFLDGAQVMYSKCFLAPPSVASPQLNTSPGAMGYFLGTIQGIEVDRFFLDITVEDALSVLGDQQMPKNLIQVGCFHQVYDAGCGLLKATFSVTGTIATAGDTSHFTTNLTQATGYFNLGGVIFNGNVTPALAGQVANVSSYVNASGALALVSALSTLPAAGDTFTIYPGCDRQQLGGCTKLSNLARFAGVPYMPVPETILDGGTDNPPPQNVGSQAGQLIGSSVSAHQTAGPYKT
jgi:hypothetical protein